ncbi:uncharacterized protein LOC111246936 isoform X2 [Varroa destructor]|uniref:Crossover junction endonuclease MUS81 n=1 Tax=Varroa destructor TaxID=109461 RepID=A0A7M7JKK1_VARDE|nr:uncharacterized protein LOC111246936 isoform X2 [Varroa destructor]
MSSDAAGFSRKRVRRVINNPNPLFTQWLREWQDEAAKAGTHAKNTYTKALQSLAKFPIPLSSGKDCIILKHFGQKICDMLDKKLIEYRGLHPEWRPQSVAVPSPVSNGSATNAKLRQTKKNSPRSQPSISNGSVKEALLTCGDANRSINTTRTTSATQPPMKKHAHFASLKVNFKPKHGRLETASLKPPGLLSVSSPPEPNTFTDEEYQNTGNGVHQPVSQQLLVGVDVFRREALSCDLAQKPKLTSKRQKTPKEPQVIDLCLDSPEHKQASDDDDSFLIPLSKRLTVDRMNCKSKNLEEYTSVQKLTPVCPPPASGNDSDCVAQYESDDDACLKIDERLASLKKLLSPVLVSTTHKPESEYVEIVQKHESIEPIENVLTQEDSFCPAKPVDSIPEESILDMSIEIRRKRQGFLAELDANTPRAAPRPKPTILDLADSQPASPRNHEKLLISLNRSTDSIPMQPLNSVLHSHHNSQKRLITVKEPETVCISPEPPSLSSQPKTKPVYVHHLSDSDDDLRPLSLRVNRQVAKPFPKKTLSTPEEDSFDVLVGSIDTPPVSRTNKDEYSSKSSDSEVVTVTAVKVNKLEIIRKKTVTGNDDMGYSGSATVPTEEPQSRKKAPLHLEYIPEGSCPSQPVSSALNDRTSCCPLALTLLPGTFEIVLCVDSCEATGGVMSKKKEAMIEALRNSGVAINIRKMNVGDYAWIAKRSDKDELVLDCIVERKRTDDLASSIKDGRYHEQKHRLVTCGIRRKIFLVEEHHRFAAGGISDLALLQAQLNTQIIGDFIVKRTPNVKASAQYLAALTRALGQRYRQRVLKSCLREEVGKLSDDHLMSWQEFNESSMKRRKVCIKQVFTRSLMVMRGMSLEKALSIISVYPTMVSLISAYEKCDELKQKEALLANVKCSISGRRLGPALSKAVYKFVSGE